MEANISTRGMKELRQKDLETDRAKVSPGRGEAKSETLHWNSVGKLKSHPERLATPGSEFCIVASDGGMKRKQRVLKPCD